MIPGDAFDLGAERLILRSIDWEQKTTVCELVSGGRFNYVTNLFYTLPLDRGYCAEVLNAQVEHTKQYVEGSKYKGKHKLSKAVLARLQKQLEAV